MLACSNDRGVAGLKEKSKLRHSQVIIDQNEDNKERRIYASSCFRTCFRLFALVKKQAEQGHGQIRPTKLQKIWLTDENFVRRMFFIDGVRMYVSVKNQFGEHTEN